MIIEGAQKIGIPDIIREFYRNNDHPVAAAKLWYAFYGQWDFKRGWEEEMANEYMRVNKFKYDQSEEGKGCFASLFSAYCMNNRRKNLNQAALPKKKSIGMQRKTVEMLLGTRYEKRPKGKTIGPFYEIDDKAYYDPEKYMYEEVSMILLIFNVASNYLLYSSSDRIC